MRAFKVHMDCVCLQQRVLSTYDKKTIWSECDIKHLIWISGRLMNSLATMSCGLRFRQTGQWSDWANWAMNCDVGHVATGLDVGYCLLPLCHRGVKRAKIVAGWGGLLWSVWPDKSWAEEKVCPTGAVLQTDKRARSTSSAVSRMC